MMNLNRRIFLRGLGGACLAAPFLSSVAERQARAGGTFSGTPKRLIVLFSHYGCLTTRWFPAKAHGQLTRADLEDPLPGETTARTLAPLAPFVDKLLLPRGIRAMNEWSFPGTLGQVNDPHTQVCGSFFTCHPVSPDAGCVNCLPGNEAKFNATPTGRSLDHIAAEQVSPSGTPLVMQIGGVRDTPLSAISYSAPNEHFPGIGEPTQAFNQLTNLFGQGTMNPDTYQVVRGKSVIDVVRDDLDNLLRVDMSQSDRKKLEDWLDLLRETEGGVTGAECTQETATRLGLPGQTGGGLNPDITGPITDNMLNLAVLTAICDANRVIFMKFPGSYVFSGLGLQSDSHGISHRIGNANMGGSCLNGVFDMIAKIDSFYAEKFAYLVGQLDSFSEGNGSVLDNSATVWFQEMSDGNSHNLNNLPILQAGSCGGYFKVGQAVNVEDGSPNLTRGNSEGECQNGQTAGNLDDVGTPANTATQPINKYFCNLLNAIGVKAGADGFPALNGTQEVTHFGKYDNTADFRGLDRVPAAINNPGEFTALRA